MRWLMAVLMLVMAVSYAADGGLLRNESGEHVAIAADTSGAIKWVKVNSDGYLMMVSGDTLEVVETTPSALNWALVNITVGTSDSAYAFANTPVELCLLNSHATQTAYFGFDGSTYGSLFPHMPFNFSNFGQDTLHLKGSGAGTTVKAVYSYE